MKYMMSVETLIGSTPLIDLTDLLRYSEQHMVCKDTGSSGKSADFCKKYRCLPRILGKYEGVNPGGSIKDRAARAMLDAAEADGSLQPGGTVIEPTSGNTGVALAMLAAVRGYSLILTMPETMSVERRLLAETYGARVVLTAGSRGMQGAVEKARELHEQTPGSIIADQFSNPANPQAHYETTGPEIWRDTEGMVDVLVAGVGTGGTISGSARFLKECKKDIQVVAVEPLESQVLSGGVAGPHTIQGLGANFVPDNFDRRVVDRIVAVASEDAHAMRYTLAKRAGILAGISSGAALWAACKLSLCKDFSNKTIVVILPDTGERYLSVKA